jgi:hypothetical protein
MAADHTPLAQRWKEVPAMQFHSPSLLQEPLRVPELEPELLEDEEGTGAAWVDEGAESGTVGALVSAGADEDVGAGAAEEVSVGALLAADEEPEPEPEEAEPEPEPESEDPELVSPAPPKVGVPVQAAEPSAARLAASPRNSTSSPG